MTITIREATGADAAEIAEVSRSALATIRQTYRPKPGVRPPSSSQSMIQLVAMIEGRIAGTVRCYRESDRLHLLGLFVHETHRKKGVARALVLRLSELARSSGAQRLSLYTIRETGNVEVFERLGFLVKQESLDSFAESDRFAQLHEVYMERAI